MMQKIVKSLEELNFIVHGVYNTSDARMNLSKYSFDLILLGGIDNNSKSEILEFINKNNIKSKIIEGRPNKDQIRKIMNNFKN